jgi:tetratricopeptide (TPR) repeat protein
MTDDANAFLDQAFAEQAAGRAAAAADRCRRALALAPALTAAHYLTGILAAENGDGATAAAALRRALRLSPLAAPLWAARSKVQLQAGNAGEARRSAAAALTLAPDSAEAWEALGLAQYRYCDYGGAARNLLRAHRLRPENTETLLSLGAALRDLRLFDAAETVYGAVINRRPDLDAGWLGRATTRLVRGDLKNGWEDFEHRWRRFPQPAWDGRALNGETLLLHAEQGFGDTLQFARYAPLAADRGADVALQVHPALVRLLRRLDPRVRVVPSDAPLPPYDLQCPLMSLPHVFGTTLDDIPFPTAYLTPEPGEATTAAARVKAAGGLLNGGLLNIGLCWAGNPAHKNDHNRSLPPALLAELLTVPGVVFRSLQTGPAEQAMPPALRAALSPPPFKLHDFAATAAYIAALDMVVTVDTSIAHLAGALGVPCRLLLPYAPDWRWLTDRADTPWYASLRLIRQKTPGDWAGVVAETAHLLSGVAAVVGERQANPAG